MSELWYVTVLYQTTRAGMGLRMGLRVALLFLVVVCGGGGHDGGVAAAAAEEEACADAPPAAHAKFTCMQYACLGLCEKKLAFLRTSCPATCGYCKYYLIASSHHHRTPIHPRPWTPVVGGPRAPSARAAIRLPLPASCLLCQWVVVEREEEAEGACRQKEVRPDCRRLLWVVIFECMEG